MIGWTRTIASKSFDNWPQLLDSAVCAEEPGAVRIPDLFCNCPGCTRYRQMLREAERFGLRMSRP